MLTPDGLSNDFVGVLGPHEGRGVIVPVGEVMVNVADELTDGVERSAANGLAREDAEPCLDQVDPGCSRRREVKVNAGMFLEPILDIRRGVDRRVVQDDVKIPVPEGAVDLLEELQEVQARVPLTALPDDATTGYVHRREQTDDPIPFVVVSLAGWEPGPQGQERLGSVEGLDLRFLIEAQNHGVVRRIQVKPDNIVDFLLGVGIGAELERPELVRLEIMALPNAADGHVRKAGLALHLAGSPVGQALWRWPQRQGHDLGDLARCDALGSARMTTLRKPVDSLSGKAAPDATDLHGRVAGETGDLDTALVLGKQEDGASTSTRSGWSRSGALEASEVGPFGLIQDDGPSLVGHAVPPGERSLHGLY